MTLSASLPLTALCVISRAAKTCTDKDGSGTAVVCGAGFYDVKYRGRLLNNTGVPTNLWVLVLVGTCYRRVDVVLLDILEQTSSLGLSNHSAAVVFHGLPA